MELVVYELLRKQKSFSSFCVLEFICEAWLYALIVMTEIQAGSAHVRDPMRLGTPAAVFTVETLQRWPSVHTALLWQRYSSTSGQRSGAPLSRRGVYGASREVIFQQEQTEVIL